MNGLKWAVNNLNTPQIPDIPEVSEEREKAPLKSPDVVPGKSQTAPVMRDSDGFTPPQALSRKWLESLTDGVQVNHTSVESQIKELSSKGRLTDTETQQLNGLMGKKKSLGIVAETAKLHSETTSLEGSLSEAVKKLMLEKDGGVSEFHAKKRYNTALAELKEHKEKVRKSQIRMVEEVPPELRYHSKLGTSETLKAAAENPDYAVVAMKKSGEMTANQVFFAEMHDGSKAVYKPTAGSTLEGQRNETGFARRTIDPNITEASRELATAKLDELMGFGVVPAVAKTAGIKGNGPGHLQQWVLGKVVYLGGNEVTNDALDKHPQLHQIAALDWLTGNTDRHPGNYMRGEDGQYYAIDNGLAWAINSHSEEFKSDALDAVAESQIHKSVHEGLKKLDVVGLAKTLKEEGFPARDIAGFLARKKVLESSTHWPTQRKIRHWMEASKQAYDDALKEATRLMGRLGK